MESGKSYHAALSVDADRLDDDQLRGYIELCGMTPMSAAELRRLCIYHRAKGRSVIPPCNHTKADGTCAGHRSKQSG